MTGTTSELTGTTSELTGTTSELTGTTSELTGTTSELTGTTSELTGTTSELTGITSELTEDLVLIESWLNFRIRLKLQLLSLFYEIFYIVWLDRDHLLYPAKN
ncbi:hypothetical protein LC653_11340 [Nostoc sp. CHAB 5784]|uniref:hypothetical protein n=1 Tax=Nostoc mirabile TaxID=2907820 RepID=UPI001E340897|nr:hypothetical protein [Nostoc mirabile]MCC5664491.1 hypothetical protein [Nostoc mirabile CHAB5784]